ncbi:hypothetical protein C8R43DRAFT_1120695 [Mycena crocata]|nr:hypothetical protein C8R43DRAFT_1120695 [Mycena crocata]
MLVHMDSTLAWILALAALFVGFPNSSNGVFGTPASPHLHPTLDLARWARKAMTLPQSHSKDGWVPELLPPTVSPPCGTSYFKSSSTGNAGHATGDQETAPWRVARLSRRSSTTSTLASLRTRAQPGRLRIVKGEPLSPRFPLSPPHISAIMILLIFQTTLTSSSPQKVADPGRTWAARPPHLGVPHFNASFLRRRTFDLCWSSAPIP